MVARITPDAVPMMTPWFFNSVTVLLGKMA